MEYSVHSKDDKTRHVIARTKCSSHSTHPLDFKLCKHIYSYGQNEVLQNLLDVCGDRNYLLQISAT